MHSVGCMRRLGFLLVFLSAVNCQAPTTPSPVSHFQTEQATARLTNATKVQAANSPLRLPLRPSEPFRAGEIGYASKDGLWKTATEATPADAIRVRALRDVAALELGEFEEVRLTVQSQPGAAANR